MYRTRADPHHPNLSLGNAGAQPVACRQLIHINLVHSSFDVDGCKLSLVVGLELAADLVLVNGVATLGELFFVVAALGRGHHHPPIPTQGSAQGLRSTDRSYSSSPVDFVKGRHFLRSTRTL